MLFSKLFVLSSLFTSLLFSTYMNHIEAHVTANPNTRDSSAPSGIMNFVVPHSCIVKTNGTSSYYPTIAIEARFSEIITTALPQEVAGWNLTIIETPILLQSGSTAVKRIFNWTILSGGLTTKELGIFPVYWSVPTTMRGSNQVFYFPIVQYCQNGFVNYWTLQGSSTSTSEGGTAAEASPQVTYSAMSAAQVTAQNIAAAVSSTSSNGWNRSDTLSLIAIILSSIAIFASLAYALKRFLDADTPMDMPGNEQIDKKIAV